MRLSRSLRRAARCGDIDRIKHLLSQGASARMADRETKATALHCACASNAVEAIPLLLSAGCDIDKPDIDGSTPLMWACSGGHAQVCKVLLASGANVEARDKELCSSLHLCSATGNVEVAKLLLDNGATIEATDKDEWRPIHWAASNGHVHIIELFLDNGANPNVRGKGGITPLHWACAEGRDEAAKALVCGGAFPRCRDERGNTPERIAKRCGHHALEQFIYTFMVDPEPFLKEHSSEKVSHDSKPKVLADHLQSPSEHKSDVVIGKKASLEKKAASENISDGNDSDKFTNASRKNNYNDKRFLLTSDDGDSHVCREEEKECRGKEHNQRSHAFSPLSSYRKKKDRLESNSKEERKDKKKHAFSPLSSYRKKKDRLES
eukprot:g904.t1